MLIFEVGKMINNKRLVLVKLSYWVCYGGIEFLDFIVIVCKLWRVVMVIFVGFLGFIEFFFLFLYV